MNFSVPEFGVQLFLSDINPPLWFLLRLLLLQFCAPFVLFLFRRLNKFNLLLLFALAMVDIIVEFDYHNPLHWAFTFYFSGYLSYYMKDYLENFKSYFSKLCTGSMYYIMIIVLIIANCTRYRYLFAPVVVFLVLQKVEKVPVHEYMKTGFFIICTHFFFERIIRKIFIILLGVTQLSMVMNFVLTSIATVICLTILGTLFKKIMPGTYSLVCGNR